MNQRAYNHLRSCDPVLARFVENVGVLKHKPRRLSSFESLVRAIAHQQLSGRAAETILTRFRGLFPNQDFPTPSQVWETNALTLRSVGFSRPKAEYVRDIASKVLSGVVPELAEAELLTDDELIARLTSVKGVGRWTVEMMLIFNLGRPDVLPVHDLSIKKGFKSVFNKRKLPEPEFLDRYGERWRPYRTAAALYLWHACVRNRPVIRAGGR